MSDRRPLQRRARATASDPLSGDYPEENELGDVMTLSPGGRCATMCLFGCISIMGCRSQVVRRLSFYPPFPAGYSVQNGELYIHDTHQGVAGGRALRVSGDESLSQRPKPREGQESIQQILLRGGLPERVRVCWVPRGKRKRLAAVLLWTTAGVPADAQLEDKSMEAALKGKQLVIFSHGNSTDIGYMFGLHYRMCFRCQVNVLAYDYSGYGWSDGKATEAALYKDIRAVYNYAVSELKVPPHNILLYGHSVGSGPSCDFAAGKKGKCLGGVILHSSIASGLRLFVSDLDGSPWFDAFRNVEKLKKVADLPMLLIHGKLDSQVPFSHSLKLEQSCREADALREKALQGGSRWCLGTPVSKVEGREKLNPELIKQRVQTWWVNNADHNDVEHKAGDEYYRRISSFLEFCVRWHAQRSATTLA